MSEIRITREGHARPIRPAGAEAWVQVDDAETGRRWAGNVAQLMDDLDELRDLRAHGPRECCDGEQQ